MRQILIDEWDPEETFTVAWIERTAASQSPVAKLLRVM